ncbi:hypothetical protein AB6E04_20155 [Vibrio amylolyticus]|uniref:hypothetical protein n=1 Tax=Vibrio amylolyticus TaxID=2847292 RepID=UPI00354D08CE
MQYDKDIQSDHKALFGLVRNLMIEHFKFVETRKQRITTYSNSNGGICHMRTTKEGLDIGFLKGARMTDTHLRLVGTGKVMRVLPVKAFDLAIITHYLEQAVSINLLRNQ